MSGRPPVTCAPVSEPRAGLLQERPLLRSRYAAQNGVAMRKAAEAGDDVPVAAHIVERFLVAEFGEQLNAALLSSSRSECMNGM